MKFIALLKKKAVYIPLSIVILIIAGISLYSVINKTDYETDQAELRVFSDEVSVTGRVVAANDVELAFETGGRATSILATVGARVSKGKALAYVNSADLYASLLDQQARLLSARVQLAEAQRGTRPTELANIKNDFDRAEDNLEIEIRDSFAVSDDVLRSKIDALFENPTSAYPNMISFGNGSRSQKLEEERVDIGYLLKGWKKKIDSLTSPDFDDTDRIEADANLKKMRDFLDHLAIASSYFEDASGITAAERESYIANISSGRASINAAISSLNTSYQTYLQSKEAFDLSSEGSTPEEIMRAEATVKSAEAGVYQAQAALARTSIVAPFDGIITKIDLRVGEQVSSGVPVIGMISNANFEIESFIPEADIAKVKVGDIGTTTLDAYGDTVPFGVIVTAIDLSETEVEGVSTYKTILQFVSYDERIRSGMTANIDLVSEIRQGVLSIPQTSVITISGKKSVLVMDASGKTVSRDIRTRSLDNSGNIEVIEGLSVGETVVTNPPKK